MRHFIVTFEETDGPSLTRICQNFLLSKTCQTFWTYSEAIIRHSHKNIKDNITFYKNDGK